MLHQARETVFWWTMQRWWGVLNIVPWSDVFILCFMLLCRISEGKLAALVVGWCSWPYDFDPAGAQILIVGYCSALVCSMLFSCYAWSRSTVVIWISLWDWPLCVNYGAVAGYLVGSFWCCTFPNLSKACKSHKEPNTGEFDINLIRGCYQWPYRST